MLPSPYGTSVSLDRKASRTNKCPQTQHVNGFTVSKDLLIQSNEVKSTESGRRFQRLIDLSLGKEDRVELLNLQIFCWVQITLYILTDLVAFAVFSFIFSLYARQHICYSAYMLSPVNLSDGCIIEKRFGPWMTLNWLKFRDISRV